MISKKICCGLFAKLNGIIEATETRIFQVCPSRAASSATDVLSSIYVGLATVSSAMLSMLALESV